MSGRASAERRLGVMLCAPAVLAMVLVAGYPILYAVYLSLFRRDLRFPDDGGFVGFDNYVAVLSSDLWWQAMINTAAVTVISVAFELVIGFALALAMRRALFGRKTIRTTVLIPYGIITVVAAFAWKFAFDANTGFVNGLLGLDQAWFSGRWTAMAVIIISEIWKTTPFMSLLLLAGLVLVPEQLQHAARVDGAGWWQRMRRVTLPLMRSSILVALLFRTLDAFRIFDAVFIMTQGSQSTETVSIVGYDTLVTRLNLGLGSAVSVLIFAAVILIAVVFVRGFGTSLAEARGEDT